MKRRLLLHLGLHKTATTFLQRRIWPNWDSVGYAGRPNPKGFETSEKAVFSIDRPVILMSNESSGGSLKRSYLKGLSWQELRKGKLEEMQRLYAADFDIGVIIGMRKPLPWILSIYKHYLKYGGVESLDGFLGLEPHSPPAFPKSDFLTMPIIRQVESILGVSPFCFYSEEMKSHPDELSAALADFAGVKSGPDFSGDSKLNEGVNEAEAKACRFINRTIINRGCLGKGFLRRNKTVGFDLAKFCGRFSPTFRDSPPLGGCKATADQIRSITSGDLEQTLRYISQMRHGAEGPSGTNPDWEAKLRELHSLASATS